MNPAAVPSSHFQPPLPSPFHHPVTCPPLCPFHTHRFRSALELSEGVTLGHLFESKPTFYSGLAALFAGAAGTAPADAASANDPAAAAQKVSVGVRAAGLPG
jgi:hypothetical protein